MPSKMNVQITGRIQNMVFYKLGDRYCVRTVPQHVKQTKATKARGKQFGVASRAGAALRRQLLPVIPFPSDNNMQTRLVSAIYGYLRSVGNASPEQVDQLAYIDGFQFTTGCTILERWKVPLIVSPRAEGGLQLHIPYFTPAKNISAPAETVAVICKISAGGFDRATGNATGGFDTSIRFDYNGVEVPAQVIQMPLPTPQGSVIVTAISFQYQMMKNGHETPANKKAFMPAGIAGAMYFGD